MATKAVAPQGHCAKCNTLNLYSDIICSECGERLPWADAIVGGKEKVRAAGSMAVLVGCFVLIGVVVTALIVVFSLVAAGVITLPR